VWEYRKSAHPCDVVASGHVWVYEYFFIAHLASQDDVNRLSRLNIAYESLKDDIMQAKTVGYIRMLTST
jgi:hypothetical protein